jgi:hypothetical protein
MIASLRNGFSKWAISAIASRDFPPNWLPKDKPLLLDHDAIGSFLEFGEPEAGCFYCYSADSETWYFDGGAWIKISGVIVN